MDATKWHKKAAGEKTCSVCGCDSVRPGVKHRSLSQEEVQAWGGAKWIKRVRVCFGTDFGDEVIKNKIP